MKLYGLIGYPLGHSFSADWFADRFREEGITDAEYRNFPLKGIDELPRLLAAHGNLCGFNVTAPYKESVIPYLDELLPDTAAIGAVNCVTVDNGRLTGHNTDWQGFHRSLEGLLGAERPRTLILGTGGVSKAAGYALRSMGMEYGVVSRTKGADGTLTYDELTRDIMESHGLIVNATPLGTWPATDGAPAIPYEFLTPRHVLFDMVYNPPATRFIEEGRRRGCRTMNGGEMLRIQAELSFGLFGF